MPEFIWKAKNKAGQKKGGKMDAINLKAVEFTLQKRGFVDIKVKEKPKDLLENIAFLQPKVTTKDVIVFCRQFSTMIDAGLPIIQCLDILQSRRKNVRSRKY